MRAALMAIVGCLALAACGPDGTPKPDIAAVPPSERALPVFAASEFDCGQRPVPPSESAAASANGGSAAARAHNALGTWGQHCANMLTLVGEQLQAAGQVASSPSASK